MIAWSEEPSDGASSDIRAAVLLPVDDDRAIALCGSRCVELTSDGSFVPAMAWRLLADGLNPEECASTLGCSTSVIASFANCLREAGLMAPHRLASQPVETLPRSEVVALLDVNITMWKRHSLLHPLFGLLDDDKERPNLLAALLVEICHYTRWAPLIALRAATNAGSDRALRSLTEFAREEADHFRLIAAGVAGLLGLTPEDVIHSRPAPGTIALLSTMQVVAERDVAAYGAVLAFSETRPENAKSTADAFSALAQKNGATHLAVDPVSNHVNEDAELSHDALGRLILEVELPLSVSTQRINGIVNAVHDVKHAFDLMYEGLVAADPDQHGYRLRQSIAWQSLSKA